MKKKRRRSLSQSLSPAETLNQILMNLPNATKLNNNNDDQKSKSPCGGIFGSSTSPLGPPSSGTTHGTSAGFCNICQKYVSNRTNHKYVHSQVFNCVTSFDLFEITTV